MFKAEETRRDARADEADHLCPELLDALDARHLLAERRLVVVPVRLEVLGGACTARLQGHVHEVHERATRRVTAEAPVNYRDSDTIG